MYDFINEIPISAISDIFTRQILFEIVVNIWYNEFAEQTQLIVKNSSFIKNFYLIERRLNPSLILIKPVGIRGV